MSLVQSNPQELLISHTYDLPRAATYVALDFPSLRDARAMVDLLGDAVDGYKVGLELLHRGGQKLIDELLSEGKRIFFDVKLHDIPNTVAGALRAICDTPVEIVNVHAAGGRRMLEAARTAVDNGRFHPKLIAVTVLTSVADEELPSMGYGLDVTSAKLVRQLAELTVDTGLDGVVASAMEVGHVKSIAPSSFEIVVPGTRPKGAMKDDQVRTMTPGAALRAGATKLVLGRPVTRSANALGALQEIWDEMLVGLNAY